MCEKPQGFVEGFFAFHNKSFFQELLFCQVLGNKNKLTESFYFIDIDYPNFF